MLSLLRRPPPSSAASLSVTRCYRGFSYSSVSSSDMSRITISGKLVRTPELSTTSSGRRCIRYTIRSWQGRERTNYFNFLCITENARCIEYLTNIPQGSRVVAEGQFSPYQLANEDGSKVQKYSIFSSFPDALHVIERPESGAAAGEATQAQEAPEPTEATQAQEAPEPTEAAQAQEEPAPTEATQAQEAPEPTEATQAQEAPEPTEATQVQEASAPTEVQEAPEPTEAAQAQEASAPTEATQAQEAPAPTEGGETPDVKPH
ncbi:hypothetical protein HOY82DRAFT_419979 [Tuber indicum]|nr:hypothetical protein HOY82DRAFT_419979 [Tuber indicum]